MTNITPQMFIDAFEQSTREQEETLLGYWSNQPRFTKYVKEELMCRVARHLECGIETEVHRIDIVLTRQHRKVVVAIEHENNFSGSGSEVSKLKKLNAPLGVLITYVSHRQRQRMVKEYSEIMLTHSDLHSSPNCSNILVIFGSYGMTPPRILEWEYFAYDGQEFNRLVSTQ